MGQRFRARLNDVTRLAGAFYNKLGQHDAPCAHVQSCTRSARVCALVRPPQADTQSSLFLFHHDLLRLPPAPHYPLRLFLKLLPQTGVQCRTLTSQSTNLDLPQTTPAHMHLLPPLLLTKMATTTKSLPMRANGSSRGRGSTTLSFSFSSSCRYA